MSNISNINLKVWPTTRWDYRPDEYSSTVTFLWEGFGFVLVYVNYPRNDIWVDRIEVGHRDVWDVTRIVREYCLRVDDDWFDSLV